MRPYETPTLALSAAALVVAMWLIWLPRHHPEAVAVWGLLAVACVLAVVQFVRPSTLAWTASVVALLGAAAWRFNDPIAPPWLHVAATGLAGLLYAEVSHLRIRARRWEAGSAGAIAVPYQGLLSAILTWCVVAVAASFVVVGGYGFVVSAWAPPIVAASLERSAGWLVALAVGGVATGVWLARSPWWLGRAVSKDEEAPSDVARLSSAGSGAPDG